MRTIYYCDHPSLISNHQRISRHAEFLNIRRYSRIRCCVWNDCYNSHLHRAYNHYNTKAFRPFCLFAWCYNRQGLSITIAGSGRTPTPCFPLNSRSSAAGNLKLRKSSIIFIFYISISDSNQSSDQYLKIDFTPE